MNIGGTRKSTKGGPAVGGFNPQASMMSGGLPFGGSMYQSTVPMNFRG